MAPAATLRASHVPTYPRSSNRRTAPCVRASALGGAITHLGSLARARPLSEPLWNDRLRERWDDHRYLSPPMGPGAICVFEFVLPSRIPAYPVGGTMPEPV